jgi:GNAT superfamily N-acetyltransferase
VSDEWTIRDMVPGDADAVRHIAAALPEWFSESGRAGIARDLERFDGIVASAGGRVVGFLIYQPDGALGWLRWIGVEPAWRRRGIGRALLAACEAWLRTAGVRELRVSTLGDAVDYEPYARTRAFYAAMGFGLLRRIPHPDNPECEEEWVMTKRLGG